LHLIKVVFTIFVLAAVVAADQDRRTLPNQIADFKFSPNLSASADDLSSNKTLPEGLAAIVKWETMDYV
jgi:hypothetical protein